MRRIILVTNGKYLQEHIAFSNLEKAMEYLKTEKKVLFTDSYRTITEKLKYEYKFIVKSYHGIFGEDEHTIQRIKLR